ncbi:MAG TPA: DUF5989 family protein [Planctomycetota bacterium]|nr:DUF5989 family protein [Planctomycetota bacterium]
MKALLREYGWFLVHEKRWWILPLVGWIALLFVAAFLAEVAAPSFVYPIF